jgi:hypothetical protein
MPLGRGGIRQGAALPMPLPLSGSRRRDPDLQP